MDQEPIEPVEVPDAEARDAEAAAPAPVPDAEEPEPAIATAPEPAPDQPSTGADTSDPASGRGGTRHLVIEVVQTLVLTLVIFLLIQNFVAQPFQVQQHSMETTFVEGDYVLVDRLTPRWSPYQRGQVVVFQAPDGWSPNAEPFIKRVIGVAGDTVEVRDDGTVAVNGAVLDEPYLFRDETGAVEPTFADAEARWVVPDGQLFVMGDHRQASEDSRVFGPIQVSSVIGRGMFSYWPLSDVGIIATPTYDNVPAP